MNTRLRLWMMLRPPRGGGVRRLIAFNSLALSYVYAYPAARILETGANLSYIKQVEIFPLWLYSVVFLGLGLGLLMTLKCRHTLLGRSIALISFALYSLYASTFYPGGPTAVFAYIVFAYASFGETSFREYEA